MRHFRKIGLRFGWMAAVAAAALPGSVHACMMSVPQKLEDIRYADVVVVGRIANYRIIRDEAFRKWMLKSPNLSPDLLKMYRDPKKSLMTDYAHFDINVEEVLFGRAPARLSATWDNSTFPEPLQMKPGRYLIALRRPNAASPPLRGPSATITPNPDAKTLTLLQAPCASAFLFEAGSGEARAIREILAARGP
jgi:hypothetical protein